MNLNLEFVVIKIQLPIQMWSHTVTILVLEIKALCLTNNEQVTSEVDVFANTAICVFSQICVVSSKILVWDKDAEASAQGQARAAL